MVKSSLLNKTKISRICRNSNDKGSTYEPTLYDVLSISVGLKLSFTEAEDLLYSAFPEMEFWEQFLSNGMSIYDVNIFLDEVGLPLWGNVKEE